MRKIILYGELGRKYGKEHFFHVSTVGEALKALSANFKDFRQHLIDSSKDVGYEVWSGRENLGEDGNEYQVVSKSDIKIIPRVLGASTGAKIVVGIILVVIAIWNPGAAMAALGSQGAVAAPMMLSMGASLILGGVATLLAPTASVASPQQSSSVNSEGYIFGGPVNTVHQGNAIPIGYGELIVGSNVISATLTTSDIPIG